MHTVHAWYARSGTINSRSLKHKHSSDKRRVTSISASILSTRAAAGGHETVTSSHKVGTMNKLLQNINIAGTSLFLQIVAGNQSLALPHVSVPDISWIDWAALKAAGFKACQAAFGSNVVLYSNSAGLQQYDPDGQEAAALEAAFGLQVLRHSDKKPAGGCEELQQQFRCEPHEMVFVGDRYLTDVVFGNRHGMLTIRVAPLTSKGEPPAVAAARLIEDACVKRWLAGGHKAPLQQLLPHDQCSRIVSQNSE